MKEKITKRRWASIGVLFIISVVAVVIVTAIGVSSKGVELDAVEQEIADTKAQNKELSEKVIKGSSLISLYQKSDELGFVKPEHVLYLNHDTSVAQLID